MSIYFCNNLISIPEELKELRSLVELEITSCPKLRNLSEESLGYLTCLKKLWIGSFADDLEEFIGLGSIHYLHTSLEELELIGWEKLTQLPDQIQHLTALRSLRIEHFNGVEALPDWLVKFPLLKSLVIKRCPKLKILPSVEVIKCLPKFKQLRFESDLPELKEEIRVKQS